MYDGFFRGRFLDEPDILSLLGFIRFRDRLRD